MSFAKINHKLWVDETWPFIKSYIGQIIQE